MFTLTGRGERMRASGPVRRAVRRLPLLALDHHGFLSSPGVLDRIRSATLAVFVRHALPYVEDIGLEPGSHASRKRVALWLLHKNPMRLVSAELLSQLTNLGPEISEIKADSLNITNTCQAFFRILPDDKYW